jgi:NAD-dependent dihydropyrimidine dehydrogenase PreA subunit
MTYVIGPECIGELDGSCVDVCPVDCIYEGLEKRYINPGECIECDACISTCPVEAISAPGDDPDPVWVEDNATFFTLTLPGRDAPLGEPGGAVALGKVGVDTPLVVSWGTDE